MDQYVRCVENSYEKKEPRPSFNESTVGRACDIRTTDLTEHERGKLNARLLRNSLLAVPFHALALHTSIVF